MAPDGSLALVGSGGAGAQLGDVRLVLPNHFGCAAGCGPDGLQQMDVARQLALETPAESNLKSTIKAHIRGEVSAGNRM